MFYRCVPFFAAVIFAISLFSACSTDSDSTSAYDYRNDYFPAMSKNSCNVIKTSDTQIAMVVTNRGNYYDSVSYSIASSTVSISQDLYFTAFITQKNFQELCDGYKQSGEYDKVICNGKYIYTLETIPSNISMAQLQTSIENQCEEILKDYPATETADTIEIPTYRNSCIVTTNTANKFQMRITEIGKRSTTQTLKSDDINGIQYLILTQYDSSVPQSTVEASCKAAKQNYASELNHTVSCGENFVQIYSWDPAYSEFQNYTSELTSLCQDINLTGNMPSNANDSPDIDIADDTLFYTDQDTTITLDSSFTTSNRVAAEE